MLKWNLEVEVQEQKDKDEQEEETVFNIYHLPFRRSLTHNRLCALL